MAIYQWGSSPCGCLDTQGVLTLPGDLRFAGSVSAPTITQDAESGQGQPLRVKAQDGDLGGDLVLKCASGDIPGAVEIANANGGSIMRTAGGDITIANGVPFVNFANATWKKLLSSQTRSSTIIPTLLGDLSFALQPGNYTYRVHLIVQTPASNNGGLRVAPGAVASGGTPSNAEVLRSILLLNATSSIVSSRSTSVTTPYLNALTTSAIYLFVAEGAFTLSLASVLEVRAAQSTSNTGATTYLVGSYAMFNKCSN